MGPGPASPYGTIVAEKCHGVQLHEHRQGTYIEVLKRSELGLVWGVHYLAWVQFGSGVGPFVPAHVATLPEGQNDGWP